MRLSEFDLIKRYFDLPLNQQIAVGIGDDCAIVDIPDGFQLAVTTDSLVAGVHFFPDVDAYRLGYKALAVNLSDLAAMGAIPKWVSLAITLPEIDEFWVSEFTRGFFALAAQFDISLIGGDTTKGPLSITISAKGIIERDKALLRKGASVGDLICVSGVLGDGAVGLACKLNQLSLSEQQPFIDALELTEPRVSLGRQLIGYASSCMDISDGLTQDLQHILNASAVSACLHLENLPLSAPMLAARDNQSIAVSQVQQFALTGGDDYELLFTISPQHYAQLIKQPMIVECDNQLTVIGEIIKTNQPEIILKQHAKTVQLALDGWDHFKQGNNK